MPKNTDSLPAWKTFGPRPRGRGSWLAPALLAGIAAALLAWVLA